MSTNHGHTEAEVGSIDRYKIWTVFTAITCSIKRWKTEGVLVNPKGITRTQISLEG